MITRSEAIIPITPLADHTGLDGYFILPTGGLVASATAALPLGVITEGDTTTGKNSVALPNFGGTVKVKVTATSPGTIVAGSYLTVKADGTVHLDSGSGARIQVARALEAGAAGELIEAYLVHPAILS
jgi:hypothetical protein